MPTHRRATDDTLPGKRPGVDEAEAALVEHYPRLVRLAYLILPPSLGRHRRVLTATVWRGRRAGRGKRTWRGNG